MHSRAVSPGPEPQPSSFLSLLDMHAAMKERFLLHQEALLVRDIPVALEELNECERALQSHARAEEDLLFPVYLRSPPVRGGAVELFVSEHRKMKRFLAQFRRELGELQPPAPDITRKILRLLDEEATFKHLMEHHDLREANILYPTLDRVTSESERRELLDAVARST